MHFMGVDPGVSGGIAVIDEHARPVRIEKMPATERDLVELLIDVRGEIAFALIEKVHAMPKQGVRSTFTFGRNFGSLLTGLIAAEIPHNEVLPIQWQRALGCVSKGDKNVTKRKAQQLFPGPRVTHTVADALLIAAHARNQHMEGVRG